MSIKDSFPLGSRLAVRVSGNNYPTVLQAIERDKSFITNAFSVGAKQVFFPPGTECRVSITTSGGRIQANAEIDKNFQDKKTGINLVKITLLSQPERIQEREDFRMDVALPATLWQVSKDAHKSPVINRSDVAMSLKCTVKDISAGGVRLLSPMPFEVGRIMFCDIELEKDNIITMTIRIRRLRQSRKVGGLHELGAEFVAPEKANDRKITKFLYEKQLRMRNLRGE